VERLLDESDEAIARFDWESVRRMAQAVLALDPENNDGVALLAAAQRGLAQNDAPATSIELSGELSGDPSAATEGETAPSNLAPPPAPAAGTAPDFPTSFGDDRYRIIRLLGEGGRKKVYLAHDGMLDRDVALAAIKTEGLGETARTRITREAQVMARLGDHPSILLIHDLALDGERPYLILPLMSGGDLESLIQQAPEHRLSLEQTLEIGKSLCRGLEFAHSQGVVHRDLKPGNIWLTPEGDTKIGDFGLALALNNSRLTQEGMMVGTVSYMPPEQAMGGEITPRTDLYALGAVLYEMVTGRPPFLGDDSVSIIGQHINTPPVAPTWHNPRCPRSLEALILRALAKNPSDRPESAAEILIALEAVETVPLAEPDEARTTGSQVLDSMAGGIFVGRHRELSELKACLEDTLSGQGRLSMLVGEPGIGKTRTAEELATYARLRGRKYCGAVATKSGACRPTGPGSRPCAPT
jgi:hypothetical protein